ncbi:MAG: hypothetical protein H0V29_03485 [Thermoleophilaceae bacterium]|nr:hypothetical protein [Thermoleophilaceae bacterium]
MQEGSKPHGHRLLEAMREEHAFTSLSHSGGLVAVAGADAAVGIDIEAMRPGRRWAEIARRTWGSTPAGEAEFYEKWTLHEALFKARGEGLEAGTDGWLTAALDVPPGYAGSVVLSVVLSVGDP